ncbi:hypothetical protein OH76DRAFT_811402 [Lentinus brumalis]|uniref:Uncharacterized protein n=1 Tax=Lentinus brumalis TaxID=2498619 RepID=A0A371D301_9APHY|nr:hypothetical protein OH76DRAFT_811402 [Polyporus brumalis]
MSIIRWPPLSLYFSPGVTHRAVRLCCTFWPRPTAPRVYGRLKASNTQPNLMPHLSLQPRYLRRRVTRRSSAIPHPAWIVSIPRQVHTLILRQQPNTDYGRPFTTTAVRCPSRTLDGNHARCSQRHPTHRSPPHAKPSSCSRQSGFHVPAFTCHSWDRHPRLPSSRSPQNEALCLGNCGFDFGFGRSCASGETHGQARSGVPPGVVPLPQASTSTPTARRLEPTARRRASTRCPWIAGRDARA